MVATAKSRLLTLLVPTEMLRLAGATVVTGLAGTIVYELFG